MTRTLKRFIDISRGVNSFAQVKGYTTKKQRKTTVAIGIGREAVGSAYDD